MMDLLYPLRARLKVPSNVSLLAWIAEQPKPVRRELFKGLSTAEIESLKFAWTLHARPNQLTPLGLWTIWLVLAGRGFGKTRTGAEFIRAEQKAGRGRMALVAATAADAREVMVEGESGILSVCPPDNKPLYEPSKRRLTWPNGAIATTYSAEEPERLRGPQHEAAWCDEAAAWKYAIDCWDNLQFGLRVGPNPRACVTTTPKPVKLVRDLVKDPGTYLTRGSTYDNRGNLAPSFFQKIIKKYEGTRLGRQEINAELLEDTPGALWTRALIEMCRVAVCPCVLRRIVVAIDPATTSEEDSDETGIVVAGLGVDDNGYVFGDYSARAKPIEWAKTAIHNYKYWLCDRIIGEANNGGEMIEATLRMVDPNCSYKAVHASRGKMTRAEPVAALYEQGRIHHVGMFEQLEDQMCTYVPGLGEDSPDRMDALVWAISELMVNEEEYSGVATYYEPVRISPI